jgi:hypothetical protein
MADKQTLQIDVNERRALFLENLQRTANFVSQNPTLTPESLKALHTHLDRSKMIAAAWCVALLPVTPQQSAPPAAPSEPIRVEAIGAPPPVVGEPAQEPIKRKGGCAKGKPRTRQKPMQVPQ